MTRTPTYALAFDFGGTKLAAGLVDTTSGIITNLIHKPSLSAEGAEACMHTCHFGSRNYNPSIY